MYYSNVQMGNAAVLLIDIQKGFADSSYWGQRNNPDLEKNVEALVSLARKNRVPVIHIQHLSTEPMSPLRPGQEGVEFAEFCHPCNGERVFQKNVNSAFIGTHLEEYLRSAEIHQLVVAGYTTDHCVSTSVRMAANLGFKVYVVGDCVATFARHFADRTYSAELVHNVSLASLNGEFASVIGSNSLDLLLSGDSVRGQR